MDVLRMFLVLEMRHGASLPWSTMARAMRGFLRSPTMSQLGVSSLDATWLEDMDDADAYKTTGVGMDYVEDVHGPSLGFKVLQTGVHDESSAARALEDAIKRFAENRGWTLTFTEHDDDGTVFIIAPLRPEEPEALSQRDRSDRFVYHVTTASRWPSIRHAGIKPMQSSDPRRMYPARVYVFRSLSAVTAALKEKIKLNPRMFQHASPEDIIVVKINPTRVRRGTRWHWDNQMWQTSGAQDAAFTYTHIPPDAIVDALVYDPNAFNEDDMLRSV